MPITDNLKALWPFDGNPNDIQDSHNFAVTAGAPTYPAGRHNQCIHTDGVADYLTAAYSGDFANGNGAPWTCTGWLNIGVVQGDTINGPGVFGRGKSGGFNTGWYVMSRQHPLGPSFGVLSLIHEWDDGTRAVGDFSDNVGSHAISPGDWHFIAFGMGDDGKLFMRLDCFDKRIVLPSHLWTKQFTYDWTLGTIIVESTGLPGAYYNGNADELYYWNRALSDAETDLLCAGLFLPFNTRASVWAG